MNLQLKDMAQPLFIESRRIRQLQVQVHHLLIRLLIYQQATSLESKEI